MDDLFLAGPGVGMVYNYWHSRFSVMGERVSTNVSEVGAQVSLQVMIRPNSFIRILITPVAYDFNFWRHMGGAQKFSGNFTTTSPGLGVIYSAGAAIALSF